MLLASILICALAYVAAFEKNEKGKKKPHHDNKPSCPGWTSSESHQHDCPPRWPSEFIRLDPAQPQINRFYFEEAGRPAQQGYLLYLTASAYVQVWDCHCGGDRFAIYDNGVFLVEANQGCDSSNALCNNLNDDPEACLAAQNGWCKITPPGISLPPGAHNLTIVPTASFYNQGYGYIQASNLNV